MSDTLARIASILLAVSFAWAGAAKLTDMRRWREALSGYALPRDVSKVAVLLVPFVEITISLMLAAVAPRVGAAAAVGVLALFSLSILRARAVRGNRLPCGCFGGSKRRDYRILMLRNGCLGVLAAVVLAAGDVDAVLPSAPSSNELLPAAFTIAGCLLIGWLAWHLVTSLRGRENR